jgi:urocanate hydratase
VLQNFTRPDLELFIARGYIDAPTRAALENLIELKDRIAANAARLLAINSEAAEITDDQARLRENIKALTATTEAKQLISRYVAKADTQESRLEQLEKDRRAALEDQARLQAELNSAIRGFALDRQLN